MTAGADEATDAPSSGDTPGDVATAPVARRPHLDGLRAVAVFLVLCFHTSVDRLSGGFVGVDVFFVLSGYLVTDLLLREVRSGQPIRFGRFYSRRVRRLLPASVVTILVTGAVFSSLGGTFAREPLAETMRASLLYVANWHFIATSADYFAADETNPLLHLWSLAVEEQYYLVWPLLLAGLVRIARRAGARRWWVLRGAIVVAGLASLTAALVLRDGDLDRAYFGTDTRAYQLLAGAALAVTPTVVRTLAARARLAGILAGAGLVAIVAVSTPWIDVDPIVRGALVTVAALAALVGLDAAPGSPTARALSLAPIVYLGQISYGIYLWHWPVILVIDDLVDISTASRTALTALVACGLASISFHLMEQPIRRAPLLDVARWPVVGAGVAVSVLAAVVAVPLITDVAVDPDVAATATELSEGTPVPPVEELQRIRSEGYGDLVECVDGAPEDCTVVEGSGPHVLLIGDSHAQAMTAAFEAMAVEHDLTLSLAVTAGCKWPRDVYVLNDAIREVCRENRTDAYDRVIPALDPDIVVLVSAPLVPGTERRQPDTPKARAMRRTVEESIAELEDGHRDVVVVEPLPRPPDDAVVDPLECMTTARFTEECRFVAAESDSWVQELTREIADAEERVTVLDVGPLACPYLPICDPVVDGTVAWWDEQHLTRERSTAIGPDLGAVFVAAGLIPT